MSQAVRSWQKGLPVRLDSAIASDRARPMMKTGRSARPSAQKGPRGHPIGDQDLLSPANSSTTKPQRPSRRQARGWLQQRLAHELGVSPSDGDLAREGRFDHSLPVAFRIAAVYDCPIDELLFARVAPGAVE